MDKNYNLRAGYMPARTNLKSSNGKILQNTVETIKRWTAKNHKIKLVEALPFKTIFANDLLAAQAEDNLAELMPFLERVSLATDETIYQPDDLIDYVYFPETAVFSEYHILEDGRTVEIAMTGREGVVGLPAVFAPHPSMNWTQVSVAGTALKISTEILKEKFNRGGEFQAALLDYLNNYIGQISQRVICNSYHTVEKRLCSWLLMVNDRNKNTKLQMTQEQLARFLGVHRPSITQIAQSLRKKKIIKYIRGSISITNRRELERAACECYEVVHRNSQESYSF